MARTVVITSQGIPGSAATGYSPGGTDVAVSDGGTGASSAAAARTNLGLGNVDNTSDANKPVSTAQGAALAAKADATALTAEVEIREAVASQLELVGKYGLRRWRAALGDAKYGRAVITALGDSIVRGMAASNTSTTVQADWILWRERGWVAQLRDLFAAQYGDPGEGYILQVLAADHEERITFSGGSSSGTIGPQQTGRSVSNGQTITYALPICTAIDIFAWWSAGVSAQWSYTIDGGAPITPAASSGSDTLYKVSITGLSLATHTLVISGPATLRGDIAGVAAFKQSAGVVVHRLGVGGRTLAFSGIRALGGALNSTASRDRVYKATWEMPDTDLGIIMFGQNDYSTQVTWSLTPAIYKTQLETVVAYNTAQGGCSLLIPDPRSSQLVQSLPYSLQDFADQMRAVAEENDHVAFADLADVWGTKEAAATAGLVQDAVHPTRKGHGDIARLIYSILTRPDLGEAA